LLTVAGPIWHFYLAGAERVVIASQELMNEICDEKRFQKVIAAALEQVRNGVHDGLFTARGEQEKVCDCPVNMYMHSNC
jgi:cytochrome P450/NADPH-cytochrome P450 reductase